MSKADRIARTRAAQDNASLIETARLKEASESAKRSRMIAQIHSLAIEFTRKLEERGYPNLDHLVVQHYIGPISYKRTRAVWKIGVRRVPFYDEYRNVNIYLTSDGKIVFGTAIFTFGKSTSTDIIGYILSCLKSYVRGLT